MPNVVSRCAPAPCLFSNVCCSTTDCKNLSEAIADRWPVAACRGFRRGSFVALSQFRSRNSMNNRLRKRSRIIGQHDVAPVMNVQTFRAHRRGHHGFAGGHCLVNLQTCAAADPQRHDHNGGLAQVIHHRRHSSCDLNRIRCPLLHSAVRIPSNNAQPRGRHFRLDRGPDFARKVIQRHRYSAPSPSRLQTSRSEPVPVHVGSERYSPRSTPVGTTVTRSRSTHCVISARSLSETAMT